MTQKIFALRHNLKDEHADLFLTWTVPADFGKKSSIIKSEEYQYTLCDEVEDEVRAWYKSLGKPIPASEYEFLKVWRDEEKAEAEIWKKFLLKKMPVK